MTKDKIGTVTLCVYAYNSVATIGKIINDILLQKGKSPHIKEILVISDGSDDGTERLAKSYEDPRISVCHFPKHEGKTARMNFATRTCTSGFIAFLDADVLLGNERTIEALIEPLVKDPSLGVTSGQIIPLSPKTFLETALSNHALAQIALEQNFDFGKTPYVFHGKLMAMRLEFAKTLVFSSSIDCGAYVFFMARKQEVGTKYVKAAKAYSQSFQMIKDEVEYIVHHRRAYHLFSKYFSNKEIKNAYALPFSIKFFMVFYQCITNPFGYLLIKMIHLYAELRLGTSYVRKEMGRTHRTRLKHEGLFPPGLSYRS